MPFNSVVALLEISSTIGYYLKLLGEHAMDLIVVDYRKREPRVRCYEKT